MVKLKLHQLLPINFMKSHRGLLLFHSTGSGKTLTSLFGMYQFPNDIIIIGPKSSKKAFTDNIKKAKLNPSRMTFYSFKKIKNMLDVDNDLFKDKSVIVDEAHNLRNETRNNLLVISALKLAHKVMLLTATPVVNYLNDLSVLVNIAKNDDVLPTNRGLFNGIYYDENYFIISNEELLKEKLRNCISYHKQIGDDENYPTSTTEKINIVMNTKQLEEYLYYVNKIILKDKQAINPYNIDFSLLDKRKRNFFLMATRQLSNTVGENGTSPKIEAIFNKVKKGPYPIVVYSNFLKNGVYALALLLEKNNITYKSITGTTHEDEVNAIVNNYNNGQFKVLLLTSAGSESLDLKNTRQLHIMEPHWTTAKIDQVIGRVIRYKSHEQLPKKSRHVAIYRYISIFPKNILNQSADEYLMEISDKKYEIFNEFIGLIKKVSIERNTVGGHRNEYLRYKHKYLKYKLASTN